MPVKQAGQARCQVPTAVVILVALTALSFWGIVRQAQKIAELNDSDWQLASCLITQQNITRACSASGSAYGCSYRAAFTVDMQTGGTTVSGATAYPDEFGPVNGYSNHRDGDEELFAEGTTHDCWYDRRYPTTADEAVVTLRVDDENNLLGARLLRGLSIVTFVSTLLCWECVCGCMRTAWLMVRDAQQRPVIPSTAASRKGGAVPEASTKDGAAPEV